MAFQVMKETLLGMKATCPSQNDTCTPLGWRLRDTIIRGRATVEVVVQGGFRESVSTQVPPVSTSGEVLFGVENVVNPPALPHQL